ncbi:MAG: DNA internalization-related competence protein ComEC/Rec2, partial [Legionellaceae bacterium]
MEVFCFFAGIALFNFKTAYPVGLFLIACWFRPRAKNFLWFFVGLTWAACHVWMVSPRAMPKAYVVSNATLEGMIVSIPLTREGRVQFDFRLSRMDEHTASGLVRLACYDHCPVLTVGDRFRLKAKLKVPHNLNNPGGFDYVASLGVHHILWTGYTKRGTFVKLPYQNQGWSFIEKRAHLAQVLETLDPHPETIGVFEALTLGLTHRLDSSAWDLFRRTGTTHLMVISGAHIGLVAGITYRLVKVLCSLYPSFFLRVPAQRIASAMGFLAASVYALMAGLGIPAQRALIGCFFIFLRFISPHPLSVWQTWRCALGVVLFFEPHAVMMPGFYLSFLAVAILIATHQRVSVQGIKKILLMQSACLFGLMPLTLFLFSYGSLNGFFANLFAIPWVSFFIIPLALLITLLAGIVPMQGLTWILIWGIKLLLGYLNWIDSFSMINLQLTFLSLLSPIALMLGMGLLFFMPHVALIPAIVILAITSFFPGYERVPWGRALIDVLDVGQGLSVVVRTAKHTLVYDTGVQFYRGSDMGKLAIIPYLKTLGVQALDAVVISHPDLDHRGGLASIQDAYAIKRLLVDDPSFYRAAYPCHKEKAWRWEGVAFKFFPIQDDSRGKNNRSCVLQVSTPQGQVLFTGDIERPAEEYLVKTYGYALASSYLMVPHHGSKTSSSAAFIEHVAPAYALVSYGFDNRYHFPHQQPLRTYEEHDVVLYDTERCGMIRIVLNPV